MLPYMVLLLLLFHLPPAGRPGKGRAEAGATYCQRGSQWVGNSQGGLRAWGNVPLCV